ncbi:condensation domain-containing protein [Amycolatopsis sp. NPDC098790]|uniref:condensation domain-containing protein n=1 Tax=Amycolatopsis sp. NPDC098790 TaxID=3363939 RepID=UPI003819CC36
MTSPAQPGDGFPLSRQHDFLRLLDSGTESGPFGPRNTIVGGWRVRGRIDVAALRGALDDLVVRHESLRTRTVLGAEPRQRVLPPSSPELTFEDLDAAPGGRDAAAERFVNRIEAGEFDAESVPQLRVVLGRFAAEDAVLSFIAHHNAVDGWSAQIVLRDLAELYAARRDGRPANLPVMRQYREFAGWQRDELASPSAARARDYWRDQLRGAAAMPLPVDRPRLPGAEFRTGWYRFLLDDGIKRAVAALAKETRTSQFMVLYAAFLLHLRDRTGETDVVLPTFSPGRGTAGFQDTIGLFYNYLPLRTNLAGARDLVDLLPRVRRTCLEGYRHELPFSEVLGQAPELMRRVTTLDGAGLAFQVIQSPYMMADTEVGGLRFTAIRRRLLSARVGSQIPDGVLWTLEPQHDGGIVGKIGYTDNMFGEAGIEAMVGEFHESLRRIFFPGFSAAAA